MTATLRQHLPAKKQRKRGREGQEERLVAGKVLHSAQFGDDAIVAEICLFSVLSVGFEDVETRMSSWRFEGGSVKRIGIDMIADVIGLTLGCAVA
jgi:hypothetical protein